jgi:hypothetical protein
MMLVVDNVARRLLNHKGRDQALCAAGITHR